MQLKQKLQSCPGLYLRNCFGEGRQIGSNAVTANPVLSCLNYDSSKNTYDLLFEYYDFVKLYQFLKIRVLFADSKKSLKLGLKMVRILLSSCTELK
jgi:hypothetical protein